MMNGRNECPECGSSAVSLRNERTRYGRGSDLVKDQLSLVPVGADRTYSCNICSYVFTNRETLQDQDALQGCL
jgi:rubredoxin